MSMSSTNGSYGWPRNYYPFLAELLGLPGLESDPLARRVLRQPSDISYTYGHRAYFWPRCPDFLDDVLDLPGLHSLDLRDCIDEDGEPVQVWSFFTASLEEYKQVDTSNLLDIKTAKKLRKKVWSRENKPRWFKLVSPERDSRKGINTPYQKLLSKRNGIAIGFRASSDPHNYDHVVAELRKQKGLESLELRQCIGAHGEKINIWALFTQRSWMMWKAGLPDETTLELTRKKLQIERHSKPDSYPLDSIF
ncbi:hypothetical protein EWM64_g540 [Hericium alpestre]|uniref:Uncharacterized protein n=1 Tax=Hericium alpestre TaxID=135208 RepID=A0A4Z0ABS1_9AGAM|nr:hypothetical protein EWM64_g540 [Hericium alpestre]